MKIVSLFTLLSSLFLSACALPGSTLDPAGPRAGSVAGLWWTMLLLATPIFFGVAGLFLYAMVRFRTTEDRPSIDRGGSTRWIVWGGVVLPAVVVFIVFLLTLRTMAANAEPEQRADLVAEVIGHQYWWEIRYPGRGIVTATDLVVPAGRPVEVRLTSEDVIHSFWVPRLAGKTDAIPGRINPIWIRADRTGEYLGECAEYCGLQHANMAFRVVALDPDQFDRWVQRQQQPAVEPTGALERAGLHAFLRPSCIGCHTIQGTPAQGRSGPDLTHLASRSTIAGGILPNNWGTVAGWIVDPQRLKPGTTMPDLAIDLETANAMAAYFATLK